jgi:hypothetical protein
MGLVSAFTALSSVTDVLTNDDLTVWQKLTRILPIVGTALLGVGMAMKSINGLTK